MRLEKLHRMGGGDKMKIMITGASGRLGKELSKLYPDALKPSHKELDITNMDAVMKYIKKHKPDVVIHLAALTGIITCEENKELAWKTNVEGTRYIVDALEAYREDAKLIYMSTPCVFSGKISSAPFDEDSLPDPQNFYGLTKALGETIIRFSRLLNWFIIRANFVPREKWPHPRAFTDRWGTYLFADDLAKAIKEVVEKANGKHGILHLVGDKRMSMYELAKITTPDIKPMTIKDYKGEFYAYRGAMPPELTQDMSLATKYWHTYKITGG